MNEIKQKEEIFTLHSQKLIFNTQDKKDILDFTHSHWSRNLVWL